ncbi:hypothetical protein [Rhodococcus sp. 4CII]|uniref:hypothetical protein n=2 Tax=unclassified Rhodococcus (in: high G+C Gram-positive bacteria) TaxID=192944 RepID=UPI0020787687|nr:hypothetical protein [Rhodococcus sp. 4CII]
MPAVTAAPTAAPASNLAANSHITFVANRRSPAAITAAINPPVSISELARDEKRTDQPDHVHDRQGSGTESPFPLHERAHLLTLAGVTEPLSGTECNAVVPSMKAMMAKLDPFR